MYLGHFCWRQFPVHLVLLGRVFKLKLEGGEKRGGWRRWGKEEREEGRKMEGGRVGGRGRRVGGRGGRVGGRENGEKGRWGKREGSVEKQGVDDEIRKRNRRQGE